jgi:hypothetical protein
MIMSLNQRPVILTERITDESWGMTQLLVRLGSEFVGSTNQGFLLSPYLNSFFCSTV